MDTILKFQKELLKSMQNSPVLVGKVRGVYLFDVSNDKKRPYILINEFSEVAFSFTSCSSNVLKFSIKIIGDINQIDECNIALQEIKKILKSGFIINEKAICSDIDDVSVGNNGKNYTCKVSVKVSYISDL